jgi:asparagine synthase (glutamine-hydrolysing)
MATVSVFVVGSTRSDTAMSLISKIRTVAEITRSFGLGWVLRRALVEARLHSGLDRMLSPVAKWPERPLQGLLRAGFDDAPDAFHRHWINKGLHPFGPAGADRLPAYRESYLAFLRSCGVRDGVCDEADRIMSGDYPFYSSFRVQSGFPPRWTPPEWQSIAHKHWSATATVSDGADIKDCWEPSRFESGYHLVRAYLASGKDSYCEAFWQLVESWRDENPPNAGPQWRCGQEASIRVMAWIFALDVFRHSPCTTASRLALLVGMMDAHARRIALTLDYARLQDNNHSVSEGMGLFCIGTCFPELRGAARYRRLGRKALEKEARRLIYEDGAFSQLSSNYHRLMLHDYIFCMAVGRAAGTRFGADMLQRVSKARDFLVSMTDPVSGRAPNSAGNDGALLLQLDSCEYPDMRPACAAANSMFEEGILWGLGPWAEVLFHLHGPKVATWGVLHPAAAAPVFKGSTCVVLRGKESWATLRCGEFRHRPRHADSLHLDLWWRGLNLAMDPGSFRYNAPAPWREGLVHTRFHNCVEVDSQDQLCKGPRYMWTNWHRSGCDRAEASEAGLLAEAWHDGYFRLEKGLIHRRTVKLGTADEWEVLDLLEGCRTHQARIHWLLPDCPHEWDGAGSLLLHTDSGKVRVHLSCTVPEGVNPVFTLVRADEHSCEGWVSRHYGKKEAALAFSMTCVCAFPLRMRTLFTPEVSS